MFRPLLPLAALPVLAVSLSAPAFAVTDRELPIAVGKSTVLTTDAKVVRVSVTDPNVSDVVVMSKNEVLVNGKKTGSTSLIVWTTAGRRIYNVVVRTDADALQSLLRSALRSNQVSAQVVGKGVVLRGHVATPDLYNAASDIAQGMAEKVINLIQVDKAPQIEVEAKIVEVNKTALDKLGLEYGELIPDTKSNSAEPGTMTFQPNSMTLGEAKQGTLSVARSRLGINLQALERDGLAKMLADPRMVTASGGKADILVGGEVPVPIQQALGTTTIEWKQYGIKLAIEPVLQKEGRMQLKVASEVSSLDYANAVKINNSQVPSLTSRKADTDVVLRTGESLVIGGLLQANDSTSVDRLPFLGDIPILGELFKSRNFQRQESELRIVVTPRLVMGSDEPIEYKEAPHVAPLLTPEKK
jgi:pilus assembly protein CpaC